MVERLTIARLGQRGDGVADTLQGPVYVPFALPGEMVEVASWPGHPDRRQLIKVEAASAERIAPGLSPFRRLRRLRAAALDDGALSQMESANGSRWPYRNPASRRPSTN